MKIVFIGSFNPITTGHLKVMKYVLNKFIDSSILIVPTSDLYKKDTLDTSFKDRYNMIKLAINNLKNVEVSDIEERTSKVLLRNPKTIETLYNLNEKVTLLIGTDNYLDLDNWYHSEELVKNFKIMVYPRKKYKKEDLKLYEKYKHNFIFLDEANLFDVSSSKLRDAIKNKKDVNNLVDKSVLNYIKEHNLYE